MNKPVKELQLEHFFGSICRGSNDYKQALARAKRVKLPKGLANYFYQSYSRDGFLTLDKAFRILFTNLREARQRQA